MSDGSTGEKTEEPTPERLRKLRKEGNVSKSQDISSAIGFIVVFSVLALSMPYIGGKLFTLFHDALLVASKIGPDNPTGGTEILYDALVVMLLCAAPPLAAEFVIKPAMTLAQIGFLFTMKPITPDIKKINPINGLKNLFNMKKVVELLKTTAKFVIISYIAYLALRDAIGDVVLMIRADLGIGITVIGKIVFEFCMKIGIAFVLIAAADAIYQKRRYIKDNMMSKYDVKQEYKQSEGDPHQKAERKRVHHEIINSASPNAVKGATTVVTNPDHIAVALRYDREEGAAPTVVAKGNRIWAEKIKAAAKEYGIPIVRNVPLAQALNELEVGDEIPEELYEAVAEVLNFVYSLAEEQKGKR
ncbi:MAG: EscU/YscU/HrcU family type III secretion system export apparatus switch protein [Myxococcota bacterium]